MKRLSFRGGHVWDTQLCAYKQMLLEVRKLVFSDDLLRQALLAHCAREKVKVPNAGLQKIRFTPKPNGTISAVLGFVTANPNKPYEIHLDEQFELSAMILACKVFGVPLPRSANKTLQLTDQGLAMTVSMKLEKPIVETLAAS